MEKYELAQETPRHSRFQFIVLTTDYYLNDSYIFD